MYYCCHPIKQNRYFAAALLPRLIAETDTFGHASALLPQLIAETKAAEKRRFRARLRAILTCSPMPTDLPMPPSVSSFAGTKDVATTAM